MLSSLNKSGRKSQNPAKPPSKPSLIDVAIAYIYRPTENQPKQALERKLVEFTASCSKIKIAEDAGNEEYLPAVIEHMRKHEKPSQKISENVDPNILIALLSSEAGMSGFERAQSISALIYLIEDYRDRNKIAHLIEDINSGKITFVNEEDKQVQLMILQIKFLEPTQVVSLYQNYKNLSESERSEIADFLLVLIEFLNLHAKTIDCSKKYIIESLTKRNLGLMKRISLIEKEIFNIAEVAKKIEEQNTIIKTSSDKIAVKNSQHLLNILTSESAAATSKIWNFDRELKSQEQVRQRIAELQQVPVASNAADFDVEDSLKILTNTDNSALQRIIQDDSERRAFKVVKSHIQKIEELLADSNNNSLSWQDKMLKGRASEFLRILKNRKLSAKYRRDGFEDLLKEKAEKVVLFQAEKLKKPKGESNKAKHLLAILDNDVSALEKMADYDEERKCQKQVKTFVKYYESRTQDNHVNELLVILRNGNMSAKNIILKFDEARVDMLRVICTTHAKQLLIDRQAKKILCSFEQTLTEHNTAVSVKLTNFTKVFQAFRPLLAKEGWFNSFLSAIAPILGWKFVPKKTRNQQFVDKLQSVIIVADVAPEPQITSADTTAPAATGKQPVPRSAYPSRPAVSSTAVPTA